MISLARTDEYSASWHVPERFRREVLIHLFKNLHPAPAPGTPLILGIHGPFGEGKTQQCTQILQGLRAHVELVSGGELESVDAGEPARLIRQRYVRCGAAKRSSPTGVVALVFNDIDAAIGDWGDRVQYTVNRQHIFGELMHLADFPTVVDGARTPRVPIIVTGNDFTKLYGPAVRAGRMRSFAWIPTDGEKADMLTRIFPELSRDQCAKAVAMFPGQPIAFFAHVRNQIADDAIWRLITHYGEQIVFDRLAKGHRPQEAAVRVTLDLLQVTGQYVLKSGEFVNHLHRE